MSSPRPDAREIGTLIVVILKAKNLPNKRNIGKQDPYCAVHLGKDTRRTKAVKKGGQHPEWDEEIRFSLQEDTEDILVRTRSHDDDLPPPVPDKKPKFNKDRKMRLSCYADDPREPELIGEVSVSLKDVLTLGETDEWYTLTNKDKYCGEVYLEMTFWSNAPKKAKARPSVSNPQYGGPGAFAPAPHSRESSSGLSSSTSKPRQRSRSPQYLTADDIMPEIDRSDRLPEVLRPAASTSTMAALAKLDLYVAPYEPRPSLATGSIGRRLPYDEFGNNQTRRRESFPPLVDNRLHNSATNHQLSSSQGFSRPPPGSLVDDISRLSLNSSHSESDYGRQTAQLTGSRPAFYEPSYPSYGSSSMSASSSLSPSYQTPAPTGQSLYPTRNQPSPFVPRTSSGFVPPEQADYSYQPTEGPGFQRTGSVSPAINGAAPYIPLSGGSVYSQSTGASPIYNNNFNTPPSSSTNPVPFTIPHPHRHSMSSAQGYLSQQQQQPQLQHQPEMYNTPLQHHPSIQSMSSLASAGSFYAPNHNDYVPQQQPTPMPYQHQQYGSQGSFHESYPPEQQVPQSNPIPPYNLPVTPQPQYQQPYPQEQEFNAPQLQPVESGPPPQSHSAPPAAHYPQQVNYDGNTSPGGAYTITTPMVPSPSGHGPRTSSGGSGLGRPLPAPQQNHVHSYSQPVVSHTGSILPFQPPMPSAQSASLLPPMMSTPPRHSAHTPPPPPPMSSFSSAASANSSFQPPVSAYELSQQWKNGIPPPVPEQLQSGLAAPFSEDGVGQGALLGRARSLPPAQTTIQRPFPDLQPSAYSVYTSIPPPPPLPAMDNAPPPPLPSLPTLSAYDEFQQRKQRLQEQQQYGTVTNIPGSVPFSPPPPPPPLHNNQSWS